MALVPSQTKWKQLSESPCSAIVTIFYHTTFLSIQFVFAPMLMLLLCVTNAVTIIDAACLIKLFFLWDGHVLVCYKLSQKKCHRLYTGLTQTLIRNHNYLLTLKHSNRTHNTISITTCDGLSSNAYLVTSSYLLLHVLQYVLSICCNCLLYHCRKWRD